MSIEDFAVLAQIAASAAMEFSTAQPIIVAAMVVVLFGGTFLAAISIHAARTAFRHNRAAEGHLRAIQALAMEIRQLSNHTEKTVEKRAAEASHSAKGVAGGGPIRVGSLSTTPEAEVEIIRSDHSELRETKMDEILLGEDQESIPDELRRTRKEYLELAGTGVAVPSSLIRGRSFFRR